MNTVLFNSLFDKWLTKQQENQVNRKGRYLHFDERIQLSEKNIPWFKNYFSNSENILRHSFYPFIKSDIITPRIKHEINPKTKKKKPVLKEKVRPIAYASHFDSLIYSWYSIILNHFYQEKLKQWKIDDCVLAYLKKGTQNKECNIHFSRDVFNFISDQVQTRGECVALAFDLSSYFDNLDHLLLKKQWSRVLDLERLPKDHYKIYKSLTNYSFIQKSYLDIRFPRPLDNVIPIKKICEPKQFREMVNNGQVIEKNPFFNSINGSKRYGEMCGIPQGSPISACLSNIYLIHFDMLINAFAKKKEGMYRRYCDDLLIICSPKDVKFFQYLITRSVNRCEVVLNEGKTEKVFFKKEGVKVTCKNEKGHRKHLQYLGFEFDGLNVYIRSSSMSRYYRRLSSKVFQTVSDAYDSEFSQGERIFRKKLYNKFTHLGKRNFIRYGIDAMRVMDNSKTIKNQIKGSIEKVERLIVKYRDVKELPLKKSAKHFRSMK